MKTLKIYNHQQTFNVSEWEDIQRIVSLLYGVQPTQVTHWGIGNQIALRGKLGELINVIGEYE